MPRPYEPRLQGGTRLLGSRLRLGPFRRYKGKGCGGKNRRGLRKLPDVPLGIVETLGLPLSIYVSLADVQDRAGARCLLAGLKPLVPRLKKIWADGAYSGKDLANWCQERGGWKLEVVERNREAEGFEVLPKRWIVERTFGWVGKSRRLSKDYERKIQISEALLEVAMIRLMLKRLASSQLGSSA